MNPSPQQGEWQSGLGYAQPSQQQIQQQALQQAAGNSPMQFLMGLVDRLVPQQSQSQPSSTQNSQYPVQGQQLQTQQNLGYANTSQPSAQPQQQSATGFEGWVSPEIVQALQSNGFGSIEDFNRYAVGLEDYTSTLENDARQAFSFLTSEERSPEEIIDFVGELRRLSGVEQPLQQQQPQFQQPEEYLRPVMQAPLPLPAGGQMGGQNFQQMSPQEIMGIHSNIHHPEQMKRFDEAMMNTPMAYWQAIAPYLITGS